MPPPAGKIFAITGSVDPSLYIEADQLKAVFLHRAHERLVRANLQRDYCPPLLPGQKEWLNRIDRLENGPLLTLANAHLAAFPWLSFLTRSFVVAIILVKVFD